MKNAIEIAKDAYSGEFVGEASTNTERVCEKAAEILLEKEWSKLTRMPGYIIMQCNNFREKQLTCSTAGDFNNCMQIRLSINKNELNSLTKQCQK
jgi:hypothetical protein